MSDRSPNGHPAIDLRGVTKRFGDVTALDGLDLAVEEGEISGYLGPNGAGKSTTIDILLDFVRPTTGEASVLPETAQAGGGGLPGNFDAFYATPWLGLVVLAFWLVVPAVVGYRRFDAADL